MIKKITVVASMLTLILTTAAQPASVFGAPQKISHGYAIPSDAKQIADNLYDLGTAKDPKTGKEVQGYAFVYRNEPVKPGNSVSAKETVCYGFIARGAKWRGAPEDWVTNPANDSGLSSSFVLNTEAGGIAKWETAALADILGNGSITSTDLSAGANTLNDANEVYFDGISNSSTIAVTIVWGIFRGPVDQREIVEWDQIYNTAYQWSSSGESGKMDFDNIATHELGHSFGMGDLYNSSCSPQTMYGYAGLGETNKQTLESGDIAGINVLY